MRPVRLPAMTLLAGAMTLAGFALVQGQESGRPLTPREQFEAIQAEWKAAANAEFVARKEAKTVAEKKAVFDKMRPDPLAYARRLLALAEAHPGDPGARDALLWIVLREHYPMAKMPFELRLDPSDEVLGRAVDLLVKHHANDLQVARTAMFLSGSAGMIPSFTRDRLFRPLFRGSQRPAGQGLSSSRLGAVSRPKVKSRSESPQECDPHSWPTR